MSGSEAPAADAGRSRSARTRHELVAAAEAAYRDVGYDAASLREIAKRAGLTHAGLLYHFANREALLAAVLERRDEVDTQRLDMHLPADVGSLDRLVELAAYNQGNRSIVELYVRLAAEAVSPDHPARPYFTEHYRRARRYAADGFRALRDEDRLRPGVDPDVAGAGLVALMDGLQVQWLTDPSAVDLATPLRHYVHGLLRA